MTSLSSSLVYLTRSWITSAGSARLLSPEPPVPLAALALPFVVAPLTSPFLALPLACVSCRTSSSTFRIRTGNVVASPLRRSSTPRCSRAVGQFDGSEWSLCSNLSWILCRGGAWLAPVHKKPSADRYRDLDRGLALLLNIAVVDQDLVNLVARFGVERGRGVLVCRGGDLGFRRRRRRHGGLVWRVRHSQLCAPDQTVRMRREGSSDAGAKLQR